LATAAAVEPPEWAAREPPLSMDVGYCSVQAASSSRTECIQEGPRLGCRTGASTDRANRVRAGNSLSLLLLTLLLLLSKQTTFGASQPAGVL
jgi:hypothetical protein